MIRRDNGTLFVRGAPYLIGCDPALERPPQLGDALRRQIGDRLVMLFGLRGSGKTAVARRLDASGRAVRVPVRITRALRADEEAYQRDTGVRELVSVSVDEFRECRDYLAVGRYSNSFYGLSQRDVFEAYEQAKSRGPGVVVLLASGSARHTVLVREAFPLVKAVLLSVDPGLRQARVNADAHRPSSQRIAVEDDDDQTMEFYRAMADIEVSNDVTLEETLTAVNRYLDQITALCDEAVFPEERARPLLRLIQALDRRGIPCAVFAGFAVLLYTKNRPATDIDILVPEVERAAPALGIELQREGAERRAVPFPHAELLGPVPVTRDAQTYVFSLTDEMVAGRAIAELPGGSIPLLRPEDIILFKAILQRGPDVGKYDRDDIVSLDKHYRLDRQYLERRAREIGCQRRALPYLDGILT